MGNRYNIDSQALRQVLGVVPEGYSQKIINWLMDALIVSDAVLDSVLISILRWETNPS